MDAIRRVGARLCPPPCLPPTNSSGLARAPSSDGQHKATHMLAQGVRLDAATRRHSTAQRSTASTAHRSIACLCSHLRAQGIGLEARRVVLLGGHEVLLDPLGLPVSDAEAEVGTTSGCSKQGLEDLSSWSTLLSQPPLLTLRGVQQRRQGGSRSTATLFTSFTAFQPQIQEASSRARQTSTPP